jgi:beta-N-acetylhexosaminidase
VRAAGVLLAAVCAIAAGGCGSGETRSDRDTTTVAAPAPTRSDRDTTTVAARAPTLRQLVGQRVVYPFAGRTIPSALEARIRRGEAAGVVFFARNVASVKQVRALARRLQAIPQPRALRAPLLLMVDQEGGPVKRLPGAPRRSALQMAATGRPTVVTAEGRATAATLRGAGMNVDLAPVFDTPRAGSALEREGRGFGTSAAQVARFATRFARGLRAGGVAATAKHFPGFGAAPANTDVAAVRIGLPASELRSVDERPFRAAIAAGVPLVMLSSAVYPAFDERPAVLSRRIATGELRERLGFAGVSVTDDLQTPAFAAYGGASGAAVRVARAGVDLLLFAQTYDGAAAAAGAVEDAVTRGRLSRNDLRGSGERVRALRRSLALP